MSWELRDIYSREGRSQHRHTKSLELSQLANQSTIGCLQSNDNWIDQVVNSSASTNEQNNFVWG